MERRAGRNRYKRRKLFRVIAAFGFAAFLLILFLSKGLLDFSQKYRSIDGYEGIVFRDNWNKRDFKRCIWGLVETESWADFTEHRPVLRESPEYEILRSHIGKGHIDQAVLSPDGNYILYVQSVYRGSGMTDDEDVYYRVLSLKDGSVTTIYSGYRQFLLVDWRG